MCVCKSDNNNMECGCVDNREIEATDFLLL